MSKQSKFPLIKTAQVADLIPYARNSRTHSDEQVTQIAASIKEFGFLNPVIVDGENGIIAGHGRVMAAKKLGMTELPAVEASHLTDAQRRAYIIADNKLALNAGWDDEMLRVEFAELSEAGFDLDLTGFSLDEIGALQIDEIPPGLTDEDAVPETPVTPVTAEGDVWLLGRHRLMCGDSTNEKDVQKLTSYFKEKTKHCISDPPYGLKYKSNHQDKHEMLINDDVFLDYIGIAKKHTDGVFFMWTSYQVVDEWVLRVKQEFNKVTNMIIWHKGGGAMGDLVKTLATDFEIALVNHRGHEIQTARTGAVWEYQKSERKKFIEKQKKSELVSVLDSIINGEVFWKIKKDNTSTYLHPTQKPVEVNQKALRTFTRKNDAVIDLFLGSGSNLIACQTLGRDCGGMELDPKYCDVIIKRWQDFTGKQATLEATGETFEELTNARLP
jgi:DNA modification methylase